MAERTARYTSQIYNVAIVYNIYRILLPLILLVTFISSRNTTLFFRINVIELAAPSLRERQEGLQELTLTILHKIANEDATAVCEIDEEALDSLRQYSFPGNVRELENIIERAMIVSTGTELELSEWLPKIDKSFSSPEYTTLEEYEKKYILEVLNITDWRVSGEQGAAKILGMNPTTLEARMKKLDIIRT